MQTPEKQSDGTFLASIDEFEYRFTIWGAKKGTEMGVILGGIIAKPGEALGELLMASEGTEDMTFAYLAKPISVALMTMAQHRRDACDLIETLCTHQVQRRLEGAEEALRNVGGYDNAYRGRLGHARKVVVAALAVQYSDFFSEIASGLAQAKLELIQKTKASKAQESSERAAA